LATWRPRHPVGWLLLGQLLGQLLGNESSLAVAIATLAVVDDTMQPTRASLWLSAPRRRPGS
jgi:hypothetical protein